MPELPEVETIRRMLAPRLIGTTVTACRVHLPRMLKNIQAEDFSSAVSGQVIVDFVRRGKFLLLRLTKGVVVIHLRMTGRLKIRDADEAMDKYCRVDFILDDKKILQYADVRTLGTLHWFADENLIDIACLKNMGPEPFDDILHDEYFNTALKESGRNVKAMLLDQSFVAGLGNIYVDEALHDSGIAPQRQACSLNEAERERLLNAVKATIQKAINNCGTSFRDYVDGEGNKGKNQDELMVYGRKNQACLRCGAILKYGKVAGRGTHWCSECQR